MNRRTNQQTDKQTDTVVSSIEYLSGEGIKKIEAGEKVLTCNCSEENTTKQ